LDTSTALLPTMNSAQTPASKFSSFTLDSFSACSFVLTISSIASSRPAYCKRRSSPLLKSSAVVSTVATATSDHALKAKRAWIWW
jgi:hypothetical protein